MKQEKLDIFQDDEEKRKQRQKNLISVIILLSGLFIGSLFVDVVQLVKSSGFSEKNLQQTDIFESSGKTWVAYTEPQVNISVLTDEACEKCDPAEALVWLRRVVPTISAKKIAYDSDEGKSLIEKFSVKTLPSYIFSESVNRTDFFNQAQVLFEQKDKEYILKTQELGVKQGRFLALPSVSADEADFGKADSKVKVVVYSDFQCPYCKIYYDSLRTVMKKYGDRVYFVYKHLPLSFHPQAKDAALASACAQEQKKFWEYADKLYAGQSEWGNTQSIRKFKDYARILGLKTAEFNKCLDDKKYNEKITSDTNEATDYGISGTPATFINEQFRGGVISADDLKLAIDTELNK